MAIKLILSNSIVGSTLGFCFGIVALAIEIPRLFLKLGFGVFSAKERSPPKCVLNSRWGSHDFATLESSGLKMHYVEKGNPDKTLLIFLHGFPEFWYSWRYQMEHFSATYWCVSPDLRGYGNTEKPSGIENYTATILIQDIKDLIVGFGRSDCILVGHDWGGALGYMFSAKYPEMVKAYIPINIPHPLSMEREAQSGWEQRLKSWYIIFFQCPLLPELFLALGDRAIFDLMFKDAGLLEKPQSSEDLDAYKYMFQEKHNWTSTLNYYRAALKCARDLDLMRKMKQIEVPVYSIFGTGDDYLSVGSAQGSKDFCVDFKETLLDGVKHWSPMQVPVKINNFIEVYLRGRGL